MISPRPDQISAALLRALATGEASASEVNSALFSELASHCPTCRAALEGFLEREKRKQNRTDESRVLSFPSSRSQGETAMPNLSGLEDLTASERLNKVRRSRSRYTGLRAARAFLDRSKRALPADSAGSRHWAELALEALRPTAVSSREEFLESATLDARAWGLIANSERIAGNLGKADQLFEDISGRVRALGVHDLRTLAELLTFGGSLRRAQRRWEESSSLLLIAAHLYQAIGDRAAHLSCLVALAYTHWSEGMFQEMLRVLDEASHLASSWQLDDPRLTLEIRHNQVLALLECGEAESAAVLLDESLSLYAQFPDSWTQTRLAYINGRTLHALGIRDHAERNYRLARKGFLELGEPYAAAMISLDLAVLLLEDQRFSEVGELALDMLVTFQKVGVHREALAAWQLFVDAAKRQEASAVLAKRLGRFLEQARQDPSLQFAAD